MELRIIIAGSRTFEDYEYLKRCVSEYLTTHSDREIIIVSGNAKGADKLGERFAEENNIKVCKFPANWQRYGRGAGRMRNLEMLDYISEVGCEGEVLAFWDDKSTGTKHTITNAEKRNICVHIFPTAIDACS